MSRGRESDIVSALNTQTSVMKNMKKWLVLKSCNADIKTMMICACEIQKTTE